MLWANPNDKEFDEVLKNLFVQNPFSGIGKISNASNQQALLQDFSNVFLAPTAKTSKNGVLIWASDRPYTHSDGKLLSSTIVNIDKTTLSISRRWSTANLKHLVSNTSKKRRPASPAGLNLRQLADMDFNWSFYSQIVKWYGPLTIWWADVDQMNRRAIHQLRHGTARDWECHICAAYVTHHWCLSLKNREC